MSDSYLSSHLILSLEQFPDDSGVPICILPLETISDASLSPETWQSVPIFAFADFTLLSMGS